MTVSTVAELLRRLEGLEAHPIAVQAELLEATRRGLDEVLARPALQDAQPGSATPGSVQPGSAPPGRS